MNELNTIYEYVSGNSKVRKLIKFKINQIEQGITDANYVEISAETNCSTKEPKQLNLPGFG